jgi:tetratricopeptide (TPR) repeat protein
MSLDSPRTRRLAVTAVLGVFWAALLAAIGLTAASAAVGALTLGALAVLAVHGSDLAALRRRVPRRPSFPTGAAAGLSSYGGSARGVASRGLAFASAAGARGAVGIGRAARHGRRRLASVESRQRASQLAERLAATARRTAEARRASAARPDRRVEAWRLNQASATLRQNGRTDEAFEHSEAALAMFRELGDRRGQALTLNSIGLALARRGESARAIERFEEALELLAWLGDRHSEGQVMANLGAVKRTQGLEEEARASWQEALARLDPDSPEHERIAEHLRLAS